VDVLRLTQQVGGVRDRVILQPQQRREFFRIQLSHTIALARGPVRAAASTTGAPAPVGRTIIAVCDYSE
jgi:hypothetical protein